MCTWSFITGSIGSSLYRSVLCKTKLAELLPIWVFLCLMHRNIGHYSAWLLSRVFKVIGFCLLPQGETGKRYNKGDSTSTQDTTVHGFSLKSSNL
jgi:hypothetical protein